MYGTRTRQCYVTRTLPVVFKSTVLLITFSTVYFIQRLKFTTHCLNSIVDINFQFVLPIETPIQQCFRGVGRAEQDELV